MNLAEAIADVLVQEDVDTVFGLVGGGIEEVVARCIGRGIRYVTARHEQGAVGMADGYSRITGGVGVALVSHGAGLSNAGTAMIVARKGRSRVLVITSDTGADEPFMPHKFDQEMFLHSTIGRFTTISDTIVAQHVLSGAFKALQRGEGPIAINLPTPVASAEVPAAWSYAPARTTRTSVARYPQGDAIEEILTMLLAAERPVLLAGRGAVHSDARAAMVALSERTGGALAETLHAKGYFQECEQSLGVSGGFGDPASQEILARADLVIAFGASLSRYTSKWGKLFSNARVVTVDTRPESEPQMSNTDLQVVADARLTAEALLSKMSDPVAPSPKAWNLKVRQGMGQVEGSPDPDANGEGVDYRQAVIRLDAALPHSRALVVDGGNLIAVPSSSLFRVEHPLDQMYPWEFWSIGVGVSMAVGAAIGRPDRLTVAFLGDGALMLGLADLDTAVRHHAPLLVVVADNGGFGAERTSFGHLGLDLGIADFSNPDIASVASGLGFRSYTAVDNNGLELCIKEMLAAGIESGPSLLNLKIDNRAATPEMERAFVDYRPI